MIRKLLLLIPVGLFALTGISWITVTSIQHTAPAPKAAPQSEQELLTQSETSLRQMLRNGSSQDAKRFTASLDALQERLNQRQGSAASVNELQDLITLYKQDGSYFSSHIVPYTNHINHCYEYETAHTELFVNILDQIGLYELLSAYQELEKIRKGFIKDPSDEAVARYKTVAKKIKAEIADLYLGPEIETPLYNYLDNHASYFETVHSVYADVGYTRVQRLRITGYAIRSTLGLLPRT